jgi:hypothetical protein
MRNRIRLAMLGLVGLAALAGGPVAAQTFNSGSTGADSAFSPTTTTTLALPPSGVFNYTTVNIPAGVTVRYTRNAANTPVTVLASSDVTIAGTIDVSGAPGGGGSSQTILTPNGGRGGPGGFDGGSGSNGIASTTGGTGLGPGGGAGGVSGVNNAAGGGFGTVGFNGCVGPGGGPAYGTATLLPLIGGSGGGGGSSGFGQTGGGAGGGGGAVLIASSGTITLTGTILATGGTGGPTAGGPEGGAGGSGGAVRLVATTIAGSGGSINAQGAPGPFCIGAGGAGRIRIEAFTNTAAVTFNAVPPSVITQATAVALANTPTLRIVSVAGINAPASPLGSFATPDITLPAGTTSPVTVAIAGTNIPVGTTVTVTAKGETGTTSSTAATLAGSPASSSASASVTIPTNEPSVISASASFTLTASSGGGPVYVQGEEVEQVRVTAGFGGPSQVAYVTKSGREIVVTPGR